jgi:hypothetical protein
MNSKTSVRGVKPRNLIQKSLREPRTQYRSRVIPDKRQKLKLKQHDKEIKDRDENN